MKEVAKKGIPKQDGSGNGTRDNKGRGGCETTQKVGKGQNPKKKYKETKRMVY